MSEGGTCGIEACNKETVFGSDRCVDHLDAANQECWNSKWYQNYPALETALKYAVTRQWICPDSYQVVIDRAEQIRSGERPSADLVILDDEFSPTTRQLFEFSIIDRVHGNTLINTAVTHPSGLCHRKARDDASHELLDLFQERLSKRTAKRVYSRAGSSIGQMNVHEIAQKLLETGISKNTIFLVYHYGKTDLMILRDFLATEGYENMLPSDDNCIPLIPIYRRQKIEPPPGFNSFPLSLEVLFRVLYPLHSLCGRNHLALIDYQ